MPREAQELSLASPCSSGENANCGPGGPKAWCRPCTCPSPAPLFTLTLPLWPGPPLTCQAPHPGLAHLLFLCGNAGPVLWVQLAPSRAQISVATPQKSLPIAPDLAVPRSSSRSLSIQFPSWFRACLSRQPDCGYHAGRTPAFPGPGAEWLL